MSTRLQIVVGVFPPGAAPKLAVRTITLTELPDAFNAFSAMLTSRPISDYIPVPEPDPEVVIS